MKNSSQSNTEKKIRSQCELKKRKKRRKNLRQLPNIEKKKKSEKGRPQFLVLQGLMITSPRDEELKINGEKTQFPQETSKKPVLFHFLQRKMIYAQESGFNQRRNAEKVRHNALRQVTQLFNEQLITFTMPDSSDVSLNKNLRKKIMLADPRTFAITLVRGKKKRIMWHIIYQG